MLLHKAYAPNRHDMLYVVFLMAGVLAAFKPYPTLSDPGLFLSMISLFPETYPRKSNRSLFVDHIIQSVYFIDLRHPLVTALLHLHSSLLLPLFHHLWLSQGTGNANFFYASTLVFGVSNGAALLDAVWSGLRVAIGKVPEGVEVTQQ